MRRCKVQFLIKWKGYSDFHNEWVSEEDCANAGEAVADFYRRFPNKPRRTRRVQFEIPLTQELKSLLRPIPPPMTEAIDDSLPSELQLNRLAYKSHRGRCEPKRGVMSRIPHSRFFIRR